MRAVIYGVKSSPDLKDAVADQLKVIREALPADRVEVAAFQEEDQSGYRKSRGPELERAIAAAVAAADEDGEAELWCWHSSRLARGNGRKDGARSLLKLYGDLLAQGVTPRSATDDGYLREEFVGMTSRQSAKYSEDLSVWTRQGLERRKAAGKPVGPVPFGYRVEKRVDGLDVLSRRVVDADLTPVVRDVHERIAAAESTGAVARWLNEQGYLTIRGKPWNADAVRWMIENDAYTGQKGYPAIIEPDLAQRAREALTRTDPAARQRRKGGRPMKDPAMLKSIAFCPCGAPLYSIAARYSQPRVYKCRNVHQANGRCDRAPIPADIAEARALEHLTLFVGDIEAWIGDRLTERDGAHDALRDALDAEKARLAILDRQREARMAELAEVGLTDIGLEVIARIDAQREAVERDIADAQARLDEWTGSLDTDAVMAYYRSVVDAVQGRVSDAQSVREVNAALADSLTGIWLEFDGSTLTADIKLRPTGDDDLDAVVAQLFGTLAPLPEAIEATAEDLAQIGAGSRTSTRWSRWPSA